MKTTKYLLLSFIALSTGHADLIEVAETPASQRAAANIVQMINSEIAHRVGVHQAVFDLLWSNPKATPDAILTKLGTKAALVFQFSRANLEHIAACAAIVGKQPTDFIDPKYLSSPRQLVFHADGTVTLKPQ